MNLFIVLIHEFIHTRLKEFVISLFIKPIIYLIIYYFCRFISFIKENLSRFFLDFLDRFIYTLIHPCWHTHSHTHTHTRARARIKALTQHK